MNFENSRDIDTSSSEATVDNATGWHAGIFYDLQVGPIGIRPEVFYSRADNLSFNYDEGGVDSNFDLSLIRIPVDVRYMLLPIGVRPYVLAASVFNISAGSGDFQDNVKDLHVAADVAFELGSLRLMPELRYSFGIGSALKDTIDVGGVNVDADTGINTFMLRLGVVF